MALTADQFSQQMVAQLRILDPSISAEVGTPERKIIDTVAQSLADNQVDLTGLAGATDIDSKYGSNLDQFTSLFGFARQGATYATGYVTFERNSPAPATINIPQGATIQSNVSTSQGQYLQYATTVGGSIITNATTSNAIPVQCTVSGSVGNAAAASLTNMVGVPLVSGVTGVTNVAPISGGTDVESDNVYKVRFKNTVFRNLAGTEDQYLALAVSTAYSTKANAIGPISQYQEYVQVPDVDDAGNLNGQAYANGSLLPSGVTIPISPTPGGVANSWTTSTSAIPYAKDIYVNPQPFVSNSQTTQYFYRQGTDFTFNYPPVSLGDTYRESEVITGVTPNFTFLNVFNPSSLTPASAALQTATPQGVLLSEFSYISSSSRNSLAHNVFNCVDVYVDGSNPTTASCIFLPGVQTFTAAPTSPLYIENFRRDGEPLVRPHPLNYFTPLFQSPLTSLPNTITITVGASVYNYYLGYHYWLVHEYDILGGSVRARDGIEWSNFLNADTTGAGVPVTVSPTPQPPVPYAPPLAPYNPGGAINSGTTTINTYTSSQQQVEVDNYEYDANVTILQATMQDATPITNDVIAHSAVPRYFKVDVTVVYSPTANQAVTNASISASLLAYFNNQTFGSVILLSDLLGIVQQTSGVANVRWSNDLATIPNKIRVYETDINGWPLHTPWIDRIVQGLVSPGATETQRLYIPGALSSYGSIGTTGTNDTFQLNWVDTGVNFTSLPIQFSTLTATTLATAIQGASAGVYPVSGIYNGITVAADVWTSATGNPLTTFQLTYNGNGSPVLPTIVNLNVTANTYDYDYDFYLHDNELPNIPTGMAVNDSAAGVIIRPRAESTFFRPGIG